MCRNLGFVVADTLCRNLGFEKVTRLKRGWVGGWSDEFSQIGLPWSEARVYTNYFGKLSHRVNQGGGKNIFFL